MPTVRGWAFLGAGLALGVLWYFLGEPELLLVGFILVVASVIATVLVRLQAIDLGISRRLGDHAVHDGDTTTITLVLNSNSRRTTRHLSITDHVEKLGTAHFEVARLPAEERVNASYRVICRPRGVYKVGPASGAISDPLGLATRELHGNTIDRLVVYPMVEDLNFPASRGAQPSYDSSSPEQTQRGGEDFYTLREYQRGDETRRIHWPSSARMDELMIRQLEAPWQARALVFLDTRASSYESTDAFETAVSGAASVVSHLVKAGFAADLWCGEASAIDTANYAVTMERLAVIQMDPKIDIRTSSAHIRGRGGGGALIMATGAADDELLAIHSLLAREYSNTIVMNVSSSIPQTIGKFHRVGAATVVVPPGSTWAIAWSQAVRTAWVASTGS